MILSLAFGEIGLLPSDFYKMSWREFFLTLHGFNKKEVRQWEHTRFISHSVYASHPERKKMPNITKFLPLPTDKSQTINEDKARLVWEKVRQKTQKRNGSKS